MPPRSQPALYRARAGRAPARYLSMNSMNDTMAHAEAELSATPEPDDRTAAERVHDVLAILVAMRQAVREALLDHHRAGNSIAVWRDEQVVWILPEDIPAEMERAAAADDSLTPQPPG
jgi:hypothetical protein